MGAIKKTFTTHCTHIQLKMIEKILILLITLTSIYNLSGQDLLESTLKGAQKKENAKTNFIAESILKKATFTPSALFHYAGNNISSEDKRYLDQVIRVKLDPTSLQSLFKKKSNTIRLSIPVSENKSFHLLMEKVDILEPGYFMETSDGRIIYPDRSKMLFYRGIVEGDNSSLASLTIVDDNVKLLISDDEGNYSINRDQNNKEIWNLYNEYKLKIKSDRYCGTIFQPTNSDQNTKNPQGGYQKKLVQNIGVDIEVDYQMYLDNGSNEATVQTYVMALMNATITVFNAEMVTMHLSKTFIWTSTAAPYPYTGMTDVGEMLTAFGQRIQDNLTGNLAHLISTMGNGVSGIAWVDVLCMPNSGDPQYFGPYSVTAGLGTATVFPDDSGDVSVFAHELGHNIGSPHTHDCSWGPNNNRALDDCVTTVPPNCGLLTPLEQTGTIMSYCNNTLLSKGFGTLPGALIRTKFNNSTCITVGTGNQCDENLTVSTATTTGNSLASSSVSSSGTVAIMGAAVFSSPNVNLNAGFEVPLGNCFEANNVGCTYTGVLTCEGGGTTTCTEYVNNTSQVIPDVTAVVSTLVVGDARTITEVKILNITGDHTYFGDLEITLTSPNNTTVTVKDFDGALGCNGNFDVSFDDDTAAGAFDCNAINPGMYKSSSQLSGFDGETSNGTWTLTVTDKGEGDTGNLTGWKLNICGTSTGGA